MSAEAMRDLTAWWAIRGLLVLGLAGCGELAPVTRFTDVEIDPHTFFQRLELDYRAIAMSTAPGYNTWQVTATPRNALGEPLEGLPAPTFRSTDTNAVKVSADGMLTALAEASDVWIIAEVRTPDNVRRVDTAVVNVTALDPPPTIASLSIDPAASDSAIRAIAGTQPANVNLARGLSISPVALDTEGDRIFGLAYEFSSLDPDVAILTWFEERQNATAVFLRPGTVRFVARTLIYGTVIADTTEFTVTMPVTGSVIMQSSLGGPAFDPVEVRIRTNGVVGWVNKVDSLLDVTFDDPTNVIEAPANVCNTLDNLFADYAPHCATGSFILPRFATAVIHPFPQFPQITQTIDSTMTVRRFPVPGVYPYRNPLTGATGRVIVSDAAPEPSP